MYFLDTNICIHFLKGEYDSIRQNILATQPHRIKIPVIVESELMYGVSKSSKKKENRKKLEAFLSAFEVVDYRQEMSPVYAELRSDCERRGDPVGPLDLLIASIVKAHNGTLVTRNTREFRRVAGLSLTEW